MIAKPYISGNLRRLALAFFLLFSLVSISQKQPLLSEKIQGAVELKGLSNERNDYFRNLMMQDIALPQLFPVKEVSFRLEYQLNYDLYPVSDGKYEVSVLPGYVKCSPLYYFGFDISDAITPQYAIITFLVRNHYGFPEDSVVFTEVPFGKTHGLYVTKSILANAYHPDLELKNIELIFSENSYNRFRDAVSRLDDYYAAAALLDSLQDWAGNYFPSGENSVWGNYLQQLEISRILHYTEHSTFVSMIRAKEYDPAGYLSLLELTHRKQTRALTILQRQISEETDGIEMKPASYWISLYYDWLSSYPSMAFHSDYRFSNYLSGLAKVSFTNGMLSHQKKVISDILSHSSAPGFYRDRLFLFGKMLSDMYAAEARARNHSGETVLALSLYDNANRIRGCIPGLGKDPVIVENINRLQSSMADSYMNLARIAAVKGNVNLAEGYLEEARKIYLREGLDWDALRIGVFEQELFDLFLEHASEMVSRKNYRKARDYIAYLKRKCSLGKYDCTSEIKTLSKEADRGLYLQLLEISGERMEADEPEEARAYLAEAVSIRHNSVGNIYRDKSEVGISSRLNQLVYDENINEGVRYLHYGNHDIALYYLNKAQSMHSQPLMKPDPRLEGYIRQAAKPVITDLINHGKVRARGYYFEESWKIFLQCRDMMSDYRLDADVSLSVMMDELEHLLRSEQCEKLRQNFHALLDKSESSRKEGEYARALNDVNKAIELVLDDTVCDLNDQEAWYARASLEYPAEYEKRKKLALKMIPGDAAGFVEAYSDLKGFYQSRGLREQGVEHVPMHDLVMRGEDRDFLKKMLDYYYLQKEDEHLRDVMRKLWDVHQYSPPAYRQRQLGKWLAASDITDGCKEPLACLNEYVPVNSSYKTLRYHYKLTWVRESGWKFRFLSLFLKNKP